MNTPELKKLCEYFTEAYDASTPLYQVEPSEFTAGGYADRILHGLGYFANGSQTIGQLGWWNLTVEQFCKEVLEQKETQERNNRRNK